MCYFIGYIVLAVVFYAVGWVLFSQGGIGMPLLGILLMGLPNLYSFFRRQSGIFATIRGWLWIILITVVLGILATPVLIVINLIKLIPWAKRYGGLKKQIDESEKIYPFVK